MRPLRMLALLAVALSAAAHVGPPRCDCARIECVRCSPGALGRGEGLAPSSVRVTEVERWTDVARWRFEVTWTAPDKRPAEGCVRIGPWPLFSAVAGSLRTDVETLGAELMPTVRARCGYLFSRSADPLLALRADRGVIDLRVFPVRRPWPAKATIEAYVLVAAQAPEGVRLYRTGERYFAVAALPLDPRAADGTLPDPQGARSLRFLSRAECLERFGTDEAQEVPFVLALETGAECRGTHAVSDDMALAALDPSSPAPSDGPDRATPVWRRALRRRSRRCSRVGSSHVPVR